MTRTIFTFLILSTLLFSCKKEPAREVTQVCLKVQHHQELMPNAKIYFKYNDSVFPGYNDLGSFDAIFEVGSDGHGCFENMPLGVHWIITDGWDANWPPNGAPFRGSMRINLTVEKYQIDSIIYVDEY